MARKSKKRKFSNNQTVVVRFSERKIVGNVIAVKPIGKRFIYDVQGEDGTIYTDLSVDLSMNECIDTYLTKLFYQKYKIDANSIPDIDQDDSELEESVTSESIIEESIIVEEEIETSNSSDNDEDEDL
jgi:hypothetical protein